MNAGKYCENFVFAGRALPGLTNAVSIFASGRIHSSPRTVMKELAGRLLRMNRLYAAR